MDPTDIRGNPILAGVGVVLILLGAMTKSWFAASIGADIPGNVANIAVDLHVGLKDVKFCTGLLGGCMSVDFNAAQINGFGDTPVYFTLGPMTYYLGILTAVFVVIAGILRVTQDASGPAKGAAAACIAMVMLGLITAASFPDAPMSPGQPSVHISWSPFVFVIGAILAAVGSFPPAEDQQQRPRHTESGPRASVSSAQFGIARDPSMVRPERDRTPASGVSHIELPPDDPAQALLQREQSSGRAPAVFSTGEQPSVELLGGAERVRYASATACIDSEGITSTNHFGDVSRLEWSDIIAVVVRRLPPKGDVSDAFIMDLIGDYVAGHLPKPLRIVRDTEVNFEALPTGATRDPFENLRRLIGYIGEVNPEIQLDKDTKYFYAEGTPPKQIKLDVEFEEYDRRYGG